MKDYEQTKISGCQKIRVEYQTSYSHEDLKMGTMENRHLKNKMVETQIL